ncbi:hypothetical protein CDL15_Pgr027010 [Punica granatum]|uniref:Uncharacterized protein n=1 Tax=Punica granatum TaxID=22663 RepID=A0A218VRI6_PUNGR|nr:hypothetical protein CDL15_Pgr027010 [Punica granatum]
MSVTRPHGKVDTPKPRDPKARNAGPDESPHSGPYSNGDRCPSSSPHYIQSNLCIIDLEDPKDSSLYPYANSTDWRCCYDEVASSMFCRWGGGVFDLSEAGFAAGAVTRCSAGCQLCRSGDCSSLGCPGRAMRDSSSGVERLRIPRGRKLESAVVLVFAVPVILALRSSVSGRLSNP